MTGMTEGGNPFHQLQRLLASLSLRPDSGKLRKNSLKIAVCALSFLCLCPCAFAETHFGIGVDTGDQKVSLVGAERPGDEQNVGRVNFSVTENNQPDKADRWNPKYDTDIDYGAYIKSFKLFLMIKKEF
jgi:hypothetical protein